MNPTLASFICACGIAGLFYLNRDDSVHTSKALWLPVIWLWIVASRPVSTWLGMSPPGGNVQLEGSPFDAAVFGLLLAAAIGVLIQRGSRARALLSANWPILIYFFYCLLSVTWSSHPDVAFKRWIKALGDLAMVLIIVTDGQPVAALKRLLSRVGFLLLPTSVLLIKYYDNLGRGYSPDGDPMNTGVTTNKNSLGIILLVVSLGTVWQLLILLRERNQPNRRRHLLAQGTLLAFGISLLAMADCKTCISCFILGSGLIIATNLRVIRGRSARVHALCLAILLFGGATFLFGGQTGIVHALGRQSNLSGRTDIWAVVIPAVPNPIVGAGFESFWISNGARKVWSALAAAGWWNPEVLINEAHNGYIEVYLNLGWIGVCLIAVIFISGYRNAGKAVQSDPALGSLMLAYIIATAVYAITEAAFRMLDPIWIFLLLAVVSASSMASALFDGKAPTSLAANSGTAGRTPVGNKLISKGGRFTASRADSRSLKCLTEAASGNASSRVIHSVIPAWEPR
jgi:exopolysaccharide production protein ExoQ